MTWDTAEVFRLLASVQVGLLALLMLRDYRRDPSALAGVFLIVTVIAHLLLPMLFARGAHRSIVHVVLVADLAVPFAFWLLAQAHFDDDFRLRPSHAGALLALLAVGYVSWLAIVERRLPEALVPHERRILWALAPKLLSLAFVGHALFNVHGGARADLVVSRLKVRYAVLMLSGGYIFLELLVETLLGGSVSGQLADNVHATTAFALIFGISLLSFRVLPEVLRPARPAPEATVLDPVVAERLQRLIELEQVFREEGLTIAALAERLAVHEYKVRQLINTQLGFRNFNAFLHHFRIREAKTALLDPARAHLGVAQIAYEVGYRSLGPFNKAFKEITGRTPTEFRSARPQS